MVWSQVSENRWERPVDGLEGYYIVAGNFSASMCEGREHYILSSTIKLEVDFPDMTSDLRYAWKQLRYEQPHIATTIEDMKRVYTVPDENMLQDWLESTFIVSQASTALELQKSVKLIKQTTLYYVPKSSELVIRAHHHTVDGTGMELLCHSFLNALAHPQKGITFGDEPSRLPPIMEEVLGYTHPSKEVKEKGQDLFWNFYVGNQPAIGPVSKLGAAPSGRCQNAEVIFSPEITALLIKACQYKDITVTTAVHAAYVQTLIEHGDPESEQSRYTTLNNFNLRPYLPEPYNSSSYAAAVYYAPHPHVINLPASYWDITASLGKSYKTAFKENPEALEVIGHFKRCMLDFVLSPEFLTIPVPKDAPVSSLGVVENFIHREYGNGIKVKDFKFGADVVLGISMIFFYTFQDQLRLVYSFNDGFEDPENIQMYLKKMQLILVQQLLL